MSSPDFTSNKAENYSRLEKASCSDPFSFLGPQYRSGLSNDPVALRVWMPGADAVWLVRKGQETVPMVREGASGFVWHSENSLSSSPYSLLVDWNGVEQEIIDPYQFHKIMPSANSLDSVSSLYHEMGAQLVTMEHGGQSYRGTRFLVFAPNASAASVVGDFNQWDGRRHPMQRLDNGLWGLFIPGVGEGERYKFELKDCHGAGLPHKADPWGFQSEQYPSFSSVVYNHHSYQWNDNGWQNRPVENKHLLPLSIYELHVGSWRRKENGDSLSYRELAKELVPYLSEMGYTHVELMPVAEHPFYGSWGYQTVGMFAPTSRFGTPDDFKFFVDCCHQEGIGVILDWVPAHFPSDDHGLANFDGTALYNDADPRRGWHQDWNSYIYDYGRDHVRKFLVSNALYWLEKFHIDGLRVDAVASMLYLDYSRKDGEWIPNEFGGNENHDAITLLKWVNEEVYNRFPNAMTIAEESTAFPGVSKPTWAGGLGFGFKWNMGWMHDSLSYIQEDPVHRCYHHNTITFPMVYAFSENYVLSLSHDEVVYGKGSIHNKMPGDEWQKAANLRAYLGYMYGQPGKKLNFMGTELGQYEEWDHDGQLGWQWLSYPKHKGIQSLVRDLNRLYTSIPALYELDASPEGFEWRMQDDAEGSVLIHERFDHEGNRVLVVTNFTPVPRESYRIGVPVSEGYYELLLNSDSGEYWGSNMPVPEKLLVEPIAYHDLGFSVDLTLLPLSTQFYRFVK